jgi:hypothetical protein
MGLPQTEELLRTYQEYKDGWDDRILGIPSKAEELPLIGSDGRFEKSAYTLGFNEARVE